VNAVRGAVLAAVALGALLAPRPLLADEPIIERIVVRFWAPETGGTGHPRFIDERTLAFEARLAAMAERQEGVGEGYQERHVRDAIDHAVGEEMLASLAHKLLAELPPGKRPSDAELAQLQVDLGTAAFDRLGGRARVEAAATAERLDAANIDALLRRQALAAWYLDRAVAPLLQPPEDQLREVYRTAAHPFRGQPFEQARGPLLRWLVVDRVHVAESAFFQAARTRVKVVVTR
jgi:hypothetical protein